MSFSPDRLPCRTGHSPAAFSPGLRLQPAIRDQARRLSGPPQAPAVYGPRPQGTWNTNGARGTVRIELKGSLELSLGPGPVPIEPVQQLSQRVVGLCELIVKIKRLLHRFPGKARIVR